MFCGNRALVLIAIAGASLLSGCGQTHTGRYRFTVTVEADGKSYSGSSVDEFSLTYRPDWQAGLAQGARIGDQQRGEAVAVNVTGHGWLFVLLDPDFARSNSNVMSMVYLNAGRTHQGAFYPGGDALMAQLEDFDSEDKARKVPISTLPIVACFRDINDPKSLKIVDPTDLSPCLGSGVVLKSATLTPTYDALSDRLVKVLPWLASHHGNESIFPGGAGVPLDFESANEAIEFHAFSTRI